MKPAPCPFCGDCGQFPRCDFCGKEPMPATRKVVLDSDLGNLQAFGVSDRDLRTIERALNSKKPVEMEETKVGARPVTTIYIDGAFFIKIEGY